MSESVKDHATVLLNGVPVKVPLEGLRDVIDQLNARNVPYDVIDNEFEEKTKKKLKACDAEKLLLSAKDNIAKKEPINIITGLELLRYYRTVYGSYSELPESYDEVIQDIQSFTEKFKIQNVQEFETTVIEEFLNFANDLQVHTKRLRFFGKTYLVAITRLEATVILGGQSYPIKFKILVKQL